MRAETKKRAGKFELLTDSNKGNETMRTTGSRQTVRPVRRQIQERREKRRTRVRQDLHQYGEGVLQSEEMQQAYRQIHHRRSTVGDHTVRVAVSSLLICYVLKRLHIPVSVPAVVVGALYHDLGILGRSEKYASGRECSREHPKDSVAVARELVDELPEKTEDIIERHMWPIGQSKAPNSIEGAVVSVADKYNAVKDLIKGSPER